jgi:hypothetical protein
VKSKEERDTPLNSAFSVTSLYRIIRKGDKRSIGRKFVSILSSVYRETGSRKCPICNSNVRRFRYFGNPPRANARCPKCGSLERQRLLWLYLSNRRRFFSAKLAVLHFAPAQCESLAFSRLANWYYVSADLRSPLAMIKADITQIPIKTGALDLVLCSHVLACPRRHESHARAAAGPQADGVRDYSSACRQDPSNHI